MSDPRLISGVRTKPAGIDANALGVIPGGRLTWVVASIHGDVARLVTLHDHLAGQISPQDNLVYLGNFLGCGPEIVATVHELLLFRRAVLAQHLDETAGEVFFLRGSQEEMWHKLLQMQFAPNPREVFEWMLARGVGGTIEAYGGSIRDGRSAANRGAVALSQWTNRLRKAVRSLDGHDKLLNDLRRAVVSDDGRLLLVNAGIDPRRPSSQQSDAFWWGSRSFDSLSAAYAGFKRVIRGFDPQHRGLQITEFTASIDGGCGFGGPLLAACFDGDGALLQSLEA